MEQNQTKMDGIVKVDNYEDYLGLSAILNSQVRYSEKNQDSVHDETLFIVLHQAIELWFMQIIVEVAESRRLIKNKQLNETCEGLERVVKIFTVLLATWDVMATLRPHQFWQFRPYFGDASGFQSAQFRELEFALGLRRGSKGFCDKHIENAPAHRKLQDELNRPSLWDEVICALPRFGFEMPKEVVSRPWRNPYPYPRLERPPAADPGGRRRAGKIVKGNSEVEEAWFRIHQDRMKYFELYRLGECLLDLSAAFTSWRSKHVATVERFLGDIRGTGGKGVRYLRSTVEKRAFPELWSVRDRFEKLVRKGPPAGQAGLA